MTNQKIIAQNEKMYSVQQPPIPIVTPIEQNVIDLTQAGNTLQFKAYYLFQKLQNVVFSFKPVNQHKRKLNGIISPEQNNNGPSPLRKSRPEIPLHRSNNKKHAGFECTFCPRFFLTLECCNIHIQKHRNRGEKGKKCSYCSEFTNSPRRHLLECVKFNRNNRSGSQTENTISDAEPEMPVLTLEAPTNPRSNLKFFEIAPWDNEINQQNVQRRQKRSKSCKLKNTLNSGAFSLCFSLQFHRFD
jgi:hypothetical protein